MIEYLAFRWFFASWLVTTVILLAVLPYREPPLIYEGLMGLWVAIPVGVIGFILDLILPGRIRGEPIFASDSKKLAYRKKYAAGSGLAYKARKVATCGDLVRDQLEGNQFAYKTRMTDSSELITSQLKISREGRSIVVYAQGLSSQWELVFESESMT